MIRVMCGYLEQLELSGRFQVMRRVRNTYASMIFTDDTEVRAVLLRIALCRQFAIP